MTSCVFSLVGFDGGIVQGWYTPEQNYNQLHRFEQASMQDSYMGSHMIPVYKRRLILKAPQKTSIALEVLKASTFARRPCGSQTCGAKLSGQRCRTGSQGSNTKSDNRGDH